MLGKHFNVLNTRTILLQAIFLLCFSVQSYSQCTAVINPTSAIADCETVTFLFTDASTGPPLSRTWDFGDGSPIVTANNPPHQFPAGFLGDTTYTITLSINCGGTTDQTTKVVTIYKKPEVEFTGSQTTVCAISESVDFTIPFAFDASNTYSWDFGDFNLSSAYAPSHTYTTGGVYDVQLTITNANGCVNTEPKSLYINAISAPSPAFSIGSSLGCTPYTSTIINTTDTAGASIVAWEWDYDDGSPFVTTQNSPAHNYPNAGTYFISLKATNSLGCFDVSNNAVLVRTTPTASISLATSTCIGTEEVVSFTGIAGPNATYTWGFDSGIADPGTATPGPHNISWLTDGNKAVSLTVLDSGCVDVATSNILVKTIPTVTLSVTPSNTICQGDSLTFNADPTTLDSYTFFKNGSIMQNGFDFRYTLTDAITNDSFAVIGHDPFGCGSDTSNFIVTTVNSLPTVTLTSSADTILEDSTIIYTAAPPVYTNYAFYQGALLLQSSASITYTSNSWVNGDSIHVVATDLGCDGPESNKIGTVVVPLLERPVVNVGTVTTTTVEFTWLAVPNATSYSVSIDSTAYVVPSSGSAGLSHIVTGLSVGDTVMIEVIASSSSFPYNSLPSILVMYIVPPVPCTGITFITSNNYDTICAGETVNFLLSGFNIPNPKVSWNGDPFALTNNAYSITPGGDIIVPVIIVNNDELTCDSIEVFFNIKVNTKPVVTLSPLLIDSVCLNTPVAFKAIPPGYSDYSFYDGTSLLQSSNNPIYQATTNTPGLDSVRVKTTYLGCQDSSSFISLKVLTIPTVTITSTPSPGNICLGDTVTFTALPSSASNYVLYNRLTSVVSSVPNEFIYSNMLIGSANNFSVIATNSNGCASDSSNVLNYTVLEIPIVTLISSDLDTAICPNDTVTFTASPSGLSSYVFYYGTNVLQTSASLTYTTSSLVFGNSISVKGTGANGCKSDFSNSFETAIKPLPQLFISADDTTICKGSSTTLNRNVVAGNNVSSFIWSTGAASISIDVNPIINTKYTLTGTLDGCEGETDTLEIIVDDTPPPIASAGDDVTICIGDSYTMNASGGLSYEWAPADSLSDLTIANPVASSRVTKTYYVTAKNLYCTNTALVTIFIDKCLSDITAPVPTGMTPNGDGVNDFFTIADVDYFGENSLQIFNRWGNIIYEKSPYQNDWDGKNSKGADLPDGTYYYVLNLGNETVHTGYVIIKR